MTPDEIDRVLTRDAAGIRASPRFAAAVMAAVQREAKTPPPIPFPWTRAAPGIAAAVFVLVLAVASIVSAPSSETQARVPAALDRVVEIATTVGHASAMLDARAALIWALVVALTVVPILAPLMLVGGERLMLVSGERDS